MSKKYLSLEEAAKLLSIPTDELKRLRERGEIRGFSDRGTWKFKHEDVDELARRQQADSNPEVPLFDDEPADYHKPLNQSDSDVKLMGGQDFDLGFDSDSDVKLVGLDQSLTDHSTGGTDADLPLLDSESDSDSDVKLIRPDSDSDVKLGAPGSDSDVKLIGPGTDSELPYSLQSDDLVAGTDSDIPLLPDSAQSDSDIRLIPEGSASAAGADDDDSVDLNLIQDDDSGISLEGTGSSLLIGGESGISLEGPNDSGIALGGEDDDEGITLSLGDSGISLDTGDSGISLDYAGESGISLDDPVDGGTIPMMNIMDDDEQATETQFEIPTLADDNDSSYDLNFDDGDTSVFDAQSSGDDTTTFDLGDDAVEEEVEASFDDDDFGPADFGDDAFDDDGDQDVFNEADYGTFDGEGDDQDFIAAAPRKRASAEAEWGTGTFVLLTVSTICMLLCGVVMMDLVKNTATASQPNPVSGMLLDLIGGMYKS